MRANKQMTPLLFALAVVLADQLTKWWVMESFMPHESKVIIAGFFDLTFITNTGAAFGLFAGEQTMGRQIFFVAVGVVALIALALIFRQQKNQSCFFSWAIGLVAGGALGNMIDRLRFGSVVDFLDFYVSNYHWPAFNVADSAITVGVGFFLLDAFLTRNHGKTRNKEEIV
ncbi:MAG: signal peptidase II [Proteobacteria bacterium]|nr:signal peptidase II [Pseudomonadota bacterium]MBU1714276.1 signal peptidase II [Pseudomonadota bacterium]